LIGNKVFVNATGRFVKGGPPADAGLTGRKIIVDTYGGKGPRRRLFFPARTRQKSTVGFIYGALCGKNIVARSAKKCEVQFAYVIGYPEPISIMVDTFGTGQVSDQKLVAIIRKHFDLTPGGIIRYLKLKRRSIKLLPAYGHLDARNPVLPGRRLTR